MSRKSVLVAASGGVDSSVAAIKLLDAGYEVSGVVFRMSPQHDATVMAAERSCRELGIKLYTVDSSEAFKSCVIDEFCRQYACGRTPNPCVICNPLVKFKLLADTADAHGIELLATGHYANIKQIGGDFILSKADSLERDQSYMLYRLPQTILSRLLFPLGNAFKPEVRAEAEQHSMASASMPDSQEICFIEGNDYASFVNSMGFSGAKGNFILPDGSKIPHKGIEHYTVGQRRGLGVSYREPLFVKQILSGGDILLATAGNEFFSSITVVNPVFNNHFDVLPDDLTVKVRSMAKNAPCKLSDCGGKLICTFETPQRAPAPGQSAVFYYGDLVVGGGFIDQTIIENK